jgi:threonine/homoserine/homoserine lactone efflux protein
VETYLLFTVTWFVAAATPGGDTMLLLGKSLANGWKSTIPYSLGIVIAKVGMITLTYLGVATLMLQAPMAFVALKYIGAGFLLWQAWRMWQAGRAEIKTRDERFWPAVGTAILYGAANPQPWMFYISVMPQVSGKTELWILNLIVTVGFAFITAFYAGLAVPIRRWMLQGNNGIWLNRTVAVLFVVLAITFVIR